MTQDGRARDSSGDSAVRQIDLRLAELGDGFEVGRALPSKQQRLVGPWCFLDHLGPADLAGGKGLHIGAHPHTCLQTFTWMMKGEILHRDSLGYEQVIRPGQVNLMTAGHGISHTEDSVGDAGQLHTAQLWIALPPGRENIPPAFEHHAELPVWGDGALTCTLLAGEFDDHRSPARVYSDMVGLDVQARTEARHVFALRPEFEYAVLVCDGSVSLDDVPLQPKRFAYIAPGQSHLTLSLQAGSRCLLIGGTPFSSEVHIWWNFVAPSREHINRAFVDWQNHDSRFGDVSGASRRLDAPRPPWMPEAGQ